MALPLLVQVATFFGAWAAIGLRTLYSLKPKKFEPAHRLTNHVKGVIAATQDGASVQTLATQINDNEGVSGMKRSLVFTMIALLAVAALAVGCKKETTTIETGTAYSETSASSTDAGYTDTSMTGMTDTSMMTGTDTSMMTTDTTGTSMMTTETSTTSVTTTNT